MVFQSLQSFFQARAPESSQETQELFESDEDGEWENVEEALEFCPLDFLSS